MFILSMATGIAPSEIRSMTLEEFNVLAKVAKKAGKLK